MSAVGTADRLIIKEQGPPENEEVMGDVKVHDGNAVGDGGHD
jgi:hypothetical protein